MSIAVNTKIVAEARVQGVTLRPIVGAYELLFGLDLTVYPESGFSRGVSIIGARVGLSTDGSSEKPVGFARPESSFEIKQGPYPNRMTPILVLPIQPGQLAAIERLRNAGDVTFELRVSGVGSDQNGVHPVQGEWRVSVPRSDWLKKLREAGARDALLLEIPLLLLDNPKEWAEITKHLQQAEGYFRAGDHRACIASCRTVLEELGHYKFGKKEWAPPLLDRLARDRATMTAQEREAALWATVNHYAHPAHHGSASGGVDDYSRADAQLLLTMVASLVGHAGAA